MVIGRPKKYRNCLDLDMDAEVYFESCIYEDDGDYIKRKEPIPFTITGLAMALSMDRDSLLNYGKDKDFFGTVKRHKLRVENDYELSLRKRGTAGEIFGLKNFGCHDKRLNEHTGKDNGPIETKSTLEAGPGLSGVLQALGRATTTRQDIGNEGGDKK